MIVEYLHKFIDTNLFYEIILSGTIGFVILLIILSFFDKTPAGEEWPMLF